MMVGGKRGRKNVFGDIKVLCSSLSKHITLARWFSLSEIIVAWMEIRSALSSHSQRSTVLVWSRELRAKSNQHCLIKYLCISHRSYLHWQHSTWQIACFLIPCGRSPNLILDLQIDPLCDALQMLRRKKVSDFLSSMRPRQNDFVITMNHCELLCYCVCFCRCTFIKIRFKIKVIADESTFVAFFLLHQDQWEEWLTKTREVCINIMGICIYCSCTFFPLQIVAKIWMGFFFFGDSDWCYG